MRTVLLMQFWFCSSSKKEACFQLWTQNSWWDAEMRAFQQNSQKSESTAPQVLLVQGPRHTNEQNTEHFVPEQIIGGCQIRSWNGVSGRMLSSHWKTSSSWLYRGVNLPATRIEVKLTALEGRFLPCIFSCTSYLNSSATQSRGVLCLACQGVTTRPAITWRTGLVKRNFKKDIFNIKACILETWLIITKQSLQLLFCCGQTRCKPWGESSVHKGTLRENSVTDRKPGISLLRHQNDEEHYKDTPFFFRLSWKKGA